MRPHRWAAAVLASCVLLSGLAPTALANDGLKVKAHEGDLKVHAKVKF